MIAHTTQRNDSVLPLMQVICTQLYNNVKKRDDHVVRLTDLDAIGGVDGGLRWHVEHQLDKIVGPLPSEQRAFKKLISDLYLLQPDGSLTGALMPESDLAKLWVGSTPFRQVLGSAEELRIVRVSSLHSGAPERICEPRTRRAREAGGTVKRRDHRSDVRRRLRKILAWSAAAGTVLAVIGAIVLSMKWANERKIASRRRGSPPGPAGRLPYAIRVLEPLKYYAVQYLPLRFADPGLPPPHRLHAACALAAFDMSNPEVLRCLVDGIPRTKPRSIISSRR